MSDDWVLRDVAKYRQFLKNMDTQDKKDYNKIQGYRRAAKEQSIKDMQSHKTVDKMHGTKTTLKDIFNNLLRVVTKVLEWQGNGSPGDDRVFQYCRLLKMEIEGRGALKKKKKKKTQKKKKKKKKTKKA